MFTGNSYKMCNIEGYVHNYYYSFTIANPSQ